MSESIRLTPGTAPLKKLWTAFLSLQMRVAFSASGAPAIGNGTTAGNLRTTASTPFTIAGQAFTKASTDDLWDLSGETDTTASQYRAYWLYLDSSGTASIVAGTNAGTAAAALLALPLPSDTLSVGGVFVADPSCDFDAAGGLAAQGTIYNGVAPGAYIGVDGVADGFVVPVAYNVKRP